MPNAVETNNHMTMLLFLTYKKAKKSKHKASCPQKLPPITINRRKFIVCFFGG